MAINEGEVEGFPHDRAPLDCRSCPGTSPKATDKADDTCRAELECPGSHDGALTTPIKTYFNQKIGCRLDYMIEYEAVRIERPDDANVIIGQTHFIKTVEDLYEAMVNSVPGIEFGIAFCEASQDRLVRVDGNDEGLIKMASNNALRVGAGHVFVVIMRKAYPINVLRAIKAVPEVCNIFCATANEVEVLVAITPRGRGVMGVVDGETPLGVENEEHVKKRKELLRAIGYKR